MDRSDPYRRLPNWDVKDKLNARSLHDTTSAALGIDFCERPFRKTIETPKLPDVALEVHPAPLPWVWDPKLFTRRSRQQLTK